MTSDQTKQKIESFVEERKEKYCLGPGEFEDAMHRAIIFGLELGKEAIKKIEAERFEESCGCCSPGYGYPIGQVDAAIQEMIDSIRI